MNKKNVLICGATGYIGLQLVKLLLKHKYTNIVYLCGNSSVGKKISFYDSTLSNKKLPKITKFNKKYLSNVDVVFSALPNGDAQKLSKSLLKKNILIDLSADFRLKKALDYKKWYKSNHKAPQNIKNSLYSIADINKKIIGKKIIACPGCYPTSIFLPLIPLLEKRLIKHKNIIIDSKSGYSGAGRSVHKKYKNKNLYNSLSVYGVANHRHNSEIQQELNIAAKKNVEFTFTPHLSPMFRGIFTSIYIDLSSKSSLEKTISCLKKYYEKSKFIKIMKKNTLLSTNKVINTNNCIISICKSKSQKKIIILSVIDNLIKGGSGQAVQNYNLIYNFKNTEGLL